MQKLIHDLAEQGLIKKSHEITIMDRYIVTPFDFPKLEGRCGCFGKFKTYKKPDPITFFIPPKSELTFRDWLPMRKDIKKNDYFLGVNRNLDVLRMSGVNKTLEFDESEYQTIVTMYADIAREGTMPDLLIVPKNSTISDKVKFQSAYGGCKVIKSSDLQNNEYLLLKLKTWVKYPNTLSCNSPGSNGRFLISKD